MIAIRTRDEVETDLRESRAALAHVETLLATSAPAAERLAAEQEDVQAQLNDAWAIAGPLQIDLRKAVSRQQVPAATELRVQYDAAINEVERLHRAAQRSNQAHNRAQRQRGEYLRLDAYHRSRIAEYEAELQRIARREGTRREGLLDGIFRRVVGAA